MKAMGVLFRNTPAHMHPDPKTSEWNRVLTSWFSELGSCTTDRICPEQHTPTCEQERGERRLTSSPPIENMGGW